MPISATSQYALATLAKKDPAFVRQALTDVAAGDNLALQALAERAGVADTGQLQEAARLFLDNKLDAVFVGAGDVRTQNTTGGNSASTFAPNAGGVSGGRMNAFIGLRGGKAADAALTTTLKDLVKQRDEKIGARDTLKTERTTHQTELDGLQLNRRERWLGSWAGVLGGDSDKGEKGTKLKDQIEGLDKQIKDLDGEIAGFTTQMHDATAQALKLNNDPQFAKLDDAAKGAHKAKAAVDDLADLVSRARSAVSSAQSAEQMEMMAEQNARMQEKNGGTAGAAGFSQWTARSAISTAESLLRDVRERAPEVEAAVRAWGKDADLGNVQTTDTGKGFDTLLDVFGMDTSNPFFGSDAMVLSNLGQASGELLSLESRVARLQAAVDEQASSASGARRGYLEDVEKKLLG